MNEKPISPQIEEGILKATRALAEGRSIEKIAADFGMPAATLRCWRHRYFAFWQSALGAAIEAVASTARGDADATAKKAAKHKRTGAFRGIRPATRTKIAQAARLLAEGVSVEAIAKRLGVVDRAVEYWKTNYPDLWRADFRKAMEGVLLKVRREAGTGAVLKDPSTYMEVAARADKWANEEGAELFPVDQVDMSLSVFFKGVFVRQFLGTAKTTTREQYEFAVRLWARATGDPPVRLISGATMAGFRDTLLGMKGRGGRPYSANTVRSKLRLVQTLLDKLGPTGPRRRDALGVLATVPYCKPPRAELDIPRIVSMEMIEKLYAACQWATKPEMVESPADWWRALLMVATYTGLRHGTLFALRWEWIDWQERTLMIPAGVLKGRRGLLLPLNQLILNHLQKIKAPAGLVFQWPYTQHWLMRELYTLERMAGIPSKEVFGFQVLRRVAATMLWRAAPEAARLILGHRSEAITIAHYVHGPSVTRGALDRLPQPETFSTPQPQQFHVQ